MVALPEISYINLDRAPQRRALMEVQAKMQGIALQRFAAIDASTIDESTFRRLSVLWERPMTRPELAAFLSHRALWEQAAQRHEGMIILEDDTVFSTHFVEAAGSVAASGYDLVNFESVGRGKFFRRNRSSDPARLRLTDLVREKSGAGAYYLSQVGARILLKTAETQTAPVDAYMFAVCRLRTAQVEPAATMQVHLLEARGFDVGLSTQTSIHQARRRLSPSGRNLGYFSRRFGTQLRLGLVQLRRLADVEFRPAAFEDEAFAPLLPISREALADELRRYEAADQSPS
ncbi:glycosyltransferase family 25 protein [Jiella pelagia]|uniref:Glycosyltransferase family 25 protein n=1 Tax=Jiella pelagia TaxID=2986949 RepID=A0ABY7C290_9HYPH|nr:glycosyltransferase family 25 protein [Jiella pelagia]WAP68878.1 glycosyltransferase family 25 protein [Jiella pelagia]